MRLVFSLDRAPLAALTLLGMLALASPARSEAAEFVHPTLGYRLWYPDDWVVDQKLLDLGGPFWVASVRPEDYVHGGILPPGGADISVEPLSGVQDEDTALNRLSTEGQPVRRQQTLAGRSVRRLEFRYKRGSNVELQRVAVAARIGERVFLFTLAYRTEARRGTDWERVLSHMIESAKEGNT